MRAIGPRHDRAAPKKAPSIDARSNTDSRVPPWTREGFTPLVIPRHTRQDDMDFYRNLPSLYDVKKI